MFDFHTSITQLKQHKEHCTTMGFDSDFSCGYGIQLRYSFSVNRGKTVLLRYYKRSTPQSDTIALSPLRLPDGSIVTEPILAQAPTSLTSARLSACPAMPTLRRGAGTLWYAIATGVAAGYKLLSAARDEKPVPVLLVATAAAAAYAVWKNEAFLYSLVAYIVQTLWGGFTTLQRLAKSLD